MLIIIIIIYFYFVLVYPEILALTSYSKSEFK